jgi:hypothetical protein
MSASMSSVSMVSASRMRVHGALDMGDVAILEAAEDMHDGVHLTNVSQELVAQALTLRGSANQARDIHEFQAGGDDLLALADRGEGLQPGSGTATRPTLGSMVQKG